jgi:hypothetical protein
MKPRLSGVSGQIPQTTDTETITLSVVVTVYVCVVIVHPVKYDLSLFRKNIFP